MALHAPNLFLRQEPFKLSSFHSFFFYLQIQHVQNLLECGNFPPVPDFYEVVVGPGGGPFLLSQGISGIEKLGVQIAYRLHTNYI